MTTIYQLLSGKKYRSLRSLQSIDGRSAAQFSFSSAILGSGFVCLVALHKAGCHNGHRFSSLTRLVSPSGTSRDLHKLLARLLTWILDSMLLIMRSAAAKRCCVLDRSCRCLCAAAASRDRSFKASWENKHTISECMVLWEVQHERP